MKNKRPASRYFILCKRRFTKGIPEIGVRLEKVILEFSEKGACEKLK
jgi:hypothetical protein